MNFAPGAVPASRSRRIVRHALIEATLLLRNPEQLLLALVIPVGLLVTGRLFAARVGLDVQAFYASIVALGLWSTTFTALAISTGFERRYGVLERLAATPLGRGGLLWGKALATTLVAIIQILAVAGVAMGVGWHPAPSFAGSVLALGVVMLCCLSFANLALSLAGSLRAETVLGLANLIYLAGAATGLVLPLSSLPSWAQLAMTCTPTAALGETLRAWSQGQSILWPLACGLAWALVSTLIARKVFRWTS